MIAGLFALGLIVLGGFVIVDAIVSHLFGRQPTPQHDDTDRMRRHLERTYPVDDPDEFWGSTR